MDNDGADHIYCRDGGDGGGCEVRVTVADNFPRDSIGVGAIRGGAALPTQGSSLHVANPPGPFMTLTSDNESRLDRLERLLINRGIRLDDQKDSHDTLLNNQKARLDKQGTQLRDQDLRLHNHETRLDKNDAILQTLQGNIGAIKSILEDQHKMSVGAMKTLDLLQERNECTPGDSGAPASPTSSFIMPPSELKRDLVMRAGRHTRFERLEIARDRKKLAIPESEAPKQPCQVRTSGIALKLCVLRSEPAEWYSNLRRENYGISRLYSYNHGHQDLEIIHRISGLGVVRWRYNRKVSGI